MKRLLAALIGADTLLWLLWPLIPHGQTSLCAARFVRVLNAEILLYLLCDRFVRPRLAELWGGAGSLGKDAFAALLGLFQWLLLSAYAGHYFWVQSEPVALVLLCFVALGLFLHLAALFIAAAALEEVNRRWLRIRHPLFASRRLHTAVGLALALAMTAIGLLTTAAPPQLSPVAIRIPNLPPSMENFRIALLTDVHIGPTVGQGRVARMVELVNEAEPDVIVIVGDLVDGFIAGLRPSLEPLRRLRPKSSLPPLFVTGNHEYYHSHIDEWLGIIRGVGLRPLRNSAAVASVGGAELCFAGVDDVSSEKSGIAGHGLNATAALSACSADSIRILLCHQPNGIKQILREEPNAPRVHLFLAGHTHAGQFYVIAPAVWLLNRFFYGHYYVSEPYATQVFVSPGVNYGGPPIKMAGFSQIPLVSLHHRASSHSHHTS